MHEHKNILKFNQSGSLVILPPELGKSAHLISRSGFSNFALYMIIDKIPLVPGQ
jgi:hypothetical protein